MKKLFFCFITLFSGCSIQSPFVREGNAANVLPLNKDDIVHTLFFIGDAGEPLPEGQELNFSILTRQASVHPSSNTIFFLGDNVYPKGLPDVRHAERSEMERRLNEQIAIVERSRAFGVFIPGNHDWEYQGKDGLATLRRQEEFIAGKGLPNVTMVPNNGYPGPSVLDIGDSIRAIAIDTQWWLHTHTKPLYTGDTTEEQTKKRFLDSLSQVLNTFRKTVVIGHHPIESHGEHGGFFDWRDHLFPLRKLVSWMWIPFPGIGSLYPISRMMGISNQDFSGSRYIELRSKLDSVLSLHSPVVYAAGHEHTLQVLDKTTHYYHIVSGKGIQKHDEGLTYGENTIFAHRTAGFMRLDFAKNGSIRLGVVEAVQGSDNGEEVFSMFLR